MKKFLLFSLLVSAMAFAQKPIFTSAKVKAATVYFNAAELQQTTSVNLPVGTSEIVIKNVADYLNENTIQIGAPSSVTVLSVQFTQNYISEYQIDESNPAIKKVRDSITLVQKEIKKVQIDIYSHQQTIALLDQNQVSGGANTGTNVVELMKLVEYYKSKRTELDNTIVTFQEKESKLKLRLQNLNRNLLINSRKEEKSSKGKLVLQVMNEVAGTVNLDINYITNSATWNPFYDLRTESVKDPINMMYKAQVSQTTGIDWKKIKLTLSSGNPNQNNQAPLLNAWFLKYQNLDNGYSFRNGDKNTIVNMLQGKASGLKVGREIADSTADSTNVIEDDNTISAVTKYTSINENQLNVTFDIDIPYDILSNGKAHSVALKEIKLPASYKYYAAPRVDKEAFLLAEINDYSKYNLLPGEANIIFEGLYVGKTNINPNQTGDTLSLSMGRDKKISIKREKVVDKSGTKFLSSYKEQTFTYDITLRNNKKEDIQMTLKDQYPLSTDKDTLLSIYWTTEKQK